MDILEFKEKLFKKAEKFGFDEHEIYYSRGQSFEVRIFRGEISQYKNAISQGVSFRGKFKGKVGYAFCEKIDESVIDILIKNAAENAEIIEDSDVEELYSGDGFYEKVDLFNEELDKFSVEEKISKAMEMEKAAYGVDKRVISVDHSVLGIGEEEILIINNKGLNISDRFNIAYAYIDVRVEESGQTKLGSEIWFHNDFNLFKPRDIATKAVDKAISYLGASSLASRRCPVIFDNTTSAMMFSTFASAFFAEDVQKGFSKLNNKIGEKIASEVVTLMDDGILKGSFGSGSFDSEGVSTKNKVVVEKGVFKTYLYNLKSAKKDGVKSTGNGFKPGIFGAIGTGCTNFYILPSNISFDGLTNKMGNGVIITKLAGLHSGCNRISGDFSLYADGFLVEEGKIIRPIEQITVAGNFFELMLNISEVGGDFRFGMPSQMGTFSMPSLLVKDLNISGV